MKNPARNQGAFVPAGLKTRLFQARDSLSDRRLGVDTFGFRPAVGKREDPERRVHYVPISYARLTRLFEQAAPGADDHFVDLGCGLGRAVFAAADRGGCRATGVEIDPELHALACANADRYAGHGKPSFVLGPAEEAMPDDVTLLYMYHPFGEGTMTRVAQSLVSSLRANPRRLRIIYENPMHGDVLDATGALRRTVSWDAGEQPGSEHPAAFWEAT